MELAVFLFTYFSSESPERIYWVILYVVGKIFSRRTQRCWHRGKRFRIDREIPEISFTTLNLGGAMKSAPLTKPPRGLCDDAQLPWLSLTIPEPMVRTFLLLCNT